jgi:hypothetical protein
MIDMWTHTLLAVGSFAAAFYAGYFIQIKRHHEAIYNTITNELFNGFIQTLDREGFIKTGIDKDGDIEIIPIKEIIKQSVNRKEITCD